MLKNIMNSSKKTKIISMIIVVVLATLLFSVYSHSKSNNHQSDNTAKQQSNSSNNKIELSKALSSSKRSIWYSLQLPDDDPNSEQPKRNTIIQMVHVIEKGKITSYRTFFSQNDINGNRIGRDKVMLVSDINKWSDNQIIQHAEDLDKQTFDMSRADENKKLEDYNDVQRAAESKKTLDAISYKKPVSKSIQLSAYDNGTNHTPIKENLKIYINDFKKGTPLEHEGMSYGSYDLIQKVYELPFGYSQTFNSVVDDQYYAGMSNMFFTKVKDSKTYYALDSNEKSRLITKTGNV